MCSALQGLKYGYISFDKGDRNEQAEMYPVPALREVWESGTSKYCPGTSKYQCQGVRDSNFKTYPTIYKKDLKWMYVLSGLRMAVFLQKCQFNNI